MRSIEEIYKYYIDCGQKIGTDTRKVVEGSIFFALKGPNFNGNLFAIQALQAGAGYAVVDEITTKDDRLLVVEDVLKTLQLLANHHRKQCKAKVLGIAGSNGKTTTKELISAVLSTSYEIQYTKGNLNNHIGVPLTLLELKSSTEIAVVELGANHIGDVEELCAIAEPDCGIITNIGKEHLEGFGSIEGVAKAESELYDFLLKNNGYSFVNKDDVWLSNMSKRLVNKSTYSIYDKACEVYLNATHLIPHIEFEYEEVPMKSHLMGEHNLQNIAATICIAKYFDINETNMALGIEHYQPQNNRSQIIETNKRNTILLDAYNANPSSVESALKTFSKMDDKPQLVLIGDMFELGKHSASEHLSIAQLCIGFTNIESILVGTEFYSTNLNADHLHLFEHKNDAIEFVKHKSFSGYNILIKGSRGMKMEDFKDLF